MQHIDVEWATWRNLQSDFFRGHVLQPPKSKFIGIAILSSRSQAVDAGFVPVEESVECVVLQTDNMCLSANQTQAIGISTQCMTCNCLSGEQEGVGKNEVTSMDHVLSTAKQESTTIHI
eukprot:11707704-Ditylum_brightwellii.AAC.1